jgi:hypothetical protein
MQIKSGWTMGACPPTIRIKMSLRKRKEEMEARRTAEANEEPKE